MVAVAAVAVVVGDGVCFTKAAPMIVIMVIALRWINGSRSRAARGTAGSQEENQPVVDARYGSHGFEPFRFEFHFVVLLIVVFLVGSIRWLGNRFLTLLPGA